jgi:hypothetical protein
MWLVLLFALIIRWLYVEWMLSVARKAISAYEGTLAELGYEES